MCLLKNHVKGTSKEPLQRCTHKTLSGTVRKHKILPQLCSSNRPQVLGSNPQRACISRALAESHFSHPRSSITRALAESHFSHPRSSITRALAESHFSHPRSSITRALAESHFSHPGSSITRALAEFHLSHPRSGMALALVVYHLSHPRSGMALALVVSHLSHPKSSMALALAVSRLSHPRSSIARALAESCTSLPLLLLGKETAPFHNRQQAVPTTVHQSSLWWMSRDRVLLGTHQSHLHHVMIGLSKGLTGCLHRMRSSQFKDHSPWTHRKMQQKVSHLKIL